MKTFGQLKKGDFIYLLGWDWRYMYRMHITGIRIYTHKFGIYIREHGYMSFPIEVLNKQTYGRWYTDIKILMDDVSTHEPPSYN